MEPLSTTSLSLEPIPQMGHRHHHRRIKPPPKKRQQLLALLLSAPFLLLLSLYLSATDLRHANPLGRRCSLSDPREYSVGERKESLRIAMVSFSDEKGRDEAVTRRRTFKGVMELVRGNKRLYADKIGYDFVDARGLVDPNRPPNWSKILAVRFSLDRYDWVFWNETESILKAAISHLNFHVSQDLVVPEDIKVVNSGAYSKGDFMVHLAGFDNKREWAARILQGLKAE